MRHGEVELETASSMEVADAVQAAAEVYATVEGLDEDSAHFLSVALREALVNAIQHAHRGKRRRRVRIRFRKPSSSTIVLSVRDEGSGFDPSGLSDPLAPANLRRGSGRGVFYMRQFADEVDFSFPQGGGCLVELKKRIPST